MVMTTRAVQFYLTQQLDFDTKMVQFLSTSAADFNLRTHVTELLPALALLTAGLDSKKSLPATSWGMSIQTGREVFSCDL